MKGWVMTHRLRTSALDAEKPLGSLLGMLPILCPLLQTALQFFWHQAQGLDCWLQTLNMLANTCLTSSLRYLTADLDGDPHPLSTVPLSHPLSHSRNHNRVRKKTENGSSFPQKSCLNVQRCSLTIFTQQFRTRAPSSCGSLSLCNSADFECSQHYSEL